MIYIYQSKEQTKLYTNTFLFKSTIDLREPDIYEQAKNVHQGANQVLYKHFNFHFKSSTDLRESDIWIKAKKLYTSKPKGK